MSYKDDILDTSTLTLEGDFESQVNQLLYMVRLTRTEVENLQVLIEDLQTTLGRPWPGCKVYPFGSIITGLGIATSDIDCYISLPGWVHINQKIVFKAKAHLQGENGVFDELFAIPMAKVPIVKFFHIPTQRHCDINFKSLAGVQNSKLIAYLLHVDPRALPLAVLIKYWAKVHNLTGTNLMPNYALTMLVIFYLQHIGILPSVHLLQQSCTEFMVDNWNTAFDSINYSSNVDNKLTLYQLLGGFFDFYSSFDFNNLIISPYMGRAVHKESFQRFDMIPDEYNLYRHNLCAGACREIRINTKMCVQDPFEHCRNCSVGVHDRHFNIVIKYIKKSTELFYEMESDKYLKAILTIAPIKLDENEIKNLQNKRPPPQLNKVMKQKQKRQNNVHQNIKKNLHMLYNHFRKEGKRY